MNNDTNNQEYGTMHPFKSAVAAAMLAVLSAGAPARAQPAAPAPMPGMTMPGMTMPSGGGAAQGPMMAAMDKMSRDMAAAPVTGDADRDFTAMMIPHHQGAIDMARYELANGKDPAMRKLARDIVAAQEKEIAAMKGWQARHPGPR